MVCGALGAVSLGCAGERAPAGAASGAPAAGAAKAGAAAAEAAPEGVSARKVVRAAELDLAVASVPKAEAEATRIVEAKGGYVAEANRAAASSEDGRDGASASLVLRVPEQELTRVLAALRRLSAGEASERITSEDVTEEYVDLEARIQNERRLEQQLAGLLKETSSVESALKVHQELARVRTEIDRHEGRRRFLATEAALATIRLSLSPARPLVSASLGVFRANARLAFSDAVAVASALVIGALRAGGVLLPFALLAALPLAAWAARRKRAAQSAASRLR